MKQTDRRDQIVEITLADAQELDEDVEIGDQIGIKIENPNCLISKAL